MTTTTAPTTPAPLRIHDHYVFPALWLLADADVLDRAAAALAADGFLVAASPHGTARHAGDPLWVQGGSARVLERRLRAVSIEAVTDTVPLPTEFEETT